MVRIDRMFKADRGLSIIETLVAIVMFALLAVMLDAVFISAHRSSRKAELGADVQQNARAAIERLTREIREASATASPAAIRAGSAPSGSDAVVFKSARLSEDANVFCLDTSSGDLHDARCFTGPPGPTVSSGSTFSPVWQQYIGYYVADVADGRELRRYVCQLSDPAASLPAPGDTAGCVASVVAKFANSSAPASAMTFDVAYDASMKTFEVTLAGNGEEVVQGSSVPSQEVLLQSKVLIRN